MDFLKAIKTAQDLPSEASSVPFDPFGPSIRDTQPFVAPAVGPQAIPGVAAVDATYHCQRFFIGRELREIDKGQKFFDDKDESAELTSIMNRCLRGEAVILHRHQATLSDGSVVVWMEWSERKPQMPQKPREEREHLTTAELKSPERMTPESEARDADDEEEDDGPTTNDEPNWE